MPVIIGAKRKLRADARKEIINNRVRSKIKTALKEFRKKPSDESLKGVFSALDSAAKKNVIPKNRADRKKSRVSAQLAKTTKQSVKTPTKAKSPAKKSRSGA